MARLVAARLGVGRILVLLAAAGLLVWSLQGSLGSPPSAPHSLNAAASSSPVVLRFSIGAVYAFSPNTAEVQPGQSVEVEVTQTDSVQHTFTLSPIADFKFNSSPTPDSPGHLTAFFQAHPALVDLTINGTPGLVEYANFTAPSSVGAYQFVCLVPGHFQAGMWGLVGDGVSVSLAGTSDTGPGAPVFIIVGVISALVVVAIVLGFVFGRREGARHEMPAERLGYSEPVPPGGGAPPTPPK